MTSPPNEPAAERAPGGARTKPVDPVLRHSLREAKILLAVWLVCTIYCTTYCYLYGYLDHAPHAASTGTPIGAWFGPLESFDRSPESLHTPFGLGIPDWVLFGIILPWLVCIAFTVFFCSYIFVEDDLGSWNQSPNSSEQ